MADPAGPGAALALVTALRQHWCVDGFLAEGRKWLDRALELPGQEEASKPGGGRVGAVCVAALVCLLQGDGPVALARLDEGDQLADAVDDRWAAGLARSLRGTADLFTGRLAEAQESFREARAIFETIGDNEGLLWLLFQLAITMAHQGDTKGAQAVCRESLKISEALGERLLRSYAQWVLGFELWLRGKEEGADMERKALALQREFNDPVGAALIIEALAWIAGRRGEPAEAARLLATAASVWSLTGTTVAAFGPTFSPHRADCVSRIELALGERGLLTARQRFRYQSIAEAIAAVLDEPGAPGAGAADSPLTAREGQIAGLIAEGMSNRAIAERLVISPRTVDGHVERILAKLAFTSRAQVAAWSAAGQ